MIELPKYSVPTYNPNSMVDNERTDFTRRIPSLPEKQLVRDSKIAMQLVRAQEQSSKKNIKLKVGDLFQQAWKGCKEPMWFKVLSIDRPLNKCRVECHSHDGFMHEEEWDDLNLTEKAFDIGEYKLITI